MHSDVEVTRQFLSENHHLVSYAGLALHLAAQQTPGACDNDLREAMESLIRTYRSAVTGLIYESRPANRIAAQVFDSFQQSMNRFGQRLFEASGLHSLRDADLLGVLVFYRRIEEALNNRRPKGRSFLHMLYDRNAGHLKQHGENHLISGPLQSGNILLP